MNKDELERTSEIPSSPEIVLSHMLRKVKRVFNCTAAAILFSDPSGEALEVVASEGFKERFIKGAKVKLGETPFSLVLFDLKPLLVNDVSKDERTKNLIWDKETKSLIWAPIFLAREVGGILALHHEKPNFFSQSDLGILETLTSQVSVIIRLTRLCRELEQLANVDSLTNLFTNYYFQRHLRLEIERCKRYSRELSLLMVDPDRLEEFNVTHGYLTGDKLLRDIAYIIRTSFRKVDVPARFGTAQFALALPETPKKGALAAGEKLRQKVEEYRFEAASGEKIAKATVSVGVATFPEDSENADGLIQKSLEALKKAKELGRNRVNSA